MRAYAFAIPTLLMIGACAGILRPEDDRINEPGNGPELDFSGPPEIVPPAPPARAPRASMPLGVNLEQVADYSVSKMFVDAFKSGRCFAPPDLKGDCGPGIEKVPVDANGWPQTDFSMILIADVPDIHGAYNFEVIAEPKDAGGITVGASHGATSGLTYSAATKKTTGKFIIPPSNDRRVLTVAVRGTKNGIKSMRILRPRFPGDNEGYPLDTKEIFYGPFVKALEPFTAIRLMDYLATNHSNISVWSHPDPAVARKIAFKRKEEALQTDAGEKDENGRRIRRGASMEYAIELANLTGKDLWINIPILADDNYIRKLAEMLYSRLHTDIKVYIEYSNEIWNWNFQQSHDNAALTHQEIIKNPQSPLMINSEVHDKVEYETLVCHEAKKDAPSDGNPNNDVCDNYYPQVKRVARKIREIGIVFREVFRDPGMERVRPVLADQAGWRTKLKMQLTWLKRVYPEPISSYIYAVAGAPYNDLGSYGLTTPNGAIVGDQYIVPPGATPIYEPQSDPKKAPKQKTARFDSRLDLTPEFVFKGLANYARGYEAFHFRDWKDFNGLFSWDKVEYKIPTLADPNAIIRQDITYQTMANYYGIRNFAYEGGHHMTGDSKGLNTPVLVAANHDPRIEDPMFEYLRAWYACGNDLFMYFQLATGYSKYGQWGLTDRIENLDAPKMRAARRIAYMKESELGKCRDRTQ